MEFSSRYKVIPSHENGLCTKDLSQNADERNIATNKLIDLDIVESTSGTKQMHYVLHVSTHDLSLIHI